MLSAVLVASIAVAVILGYKTKINTGFFCIAFAYLIGCFGMGLKTKELIGFWPVSTMFVILSVSLFYNFAAVNGTLEKMSASLLYMCRKFPGMLPFALFFVAVVLSVMGAAYFTVLAFLAPITILICEEAKMDKLTGAVAINCGALAGGNFPTASLGVVFRGLIDTAYEAEPAFEATNSFVDEMKIFGFAIVFSLILIAIFRFGFKSNRGIGKGVTFNRPEPFDKKQKTTLHLMILMMVIVLVFPLLKMAVPGNELIAKIAGKVDVGLVAFFFTIIALLFDLAPQKEVIARVPWNTILMIAGAGMLIAVAVQAGTIDAFCMDWFQCSDSPDSAGIQLCRRIYEFLQFYNRCCSTSPVPADSGTCGSNRIKSGSTLCLHDSWCTEQCDQPVLIRRQPDSWFLRKRGRPKSPVQPPAFCGSADQRYLLCGI